MDWAKFSSSTSVKSSTPTADYTPKDFDYTELEIKKKNGKIRKIVNPSRSLKTWQRRRIGTLYDLFRKEAKKKRVEDVFHGFILKRNSITAATKHIPYKVTMMFDISNFFDNVLKDTVCTVVKIKDLKHYQHFFHKAGYAAQGFPTSPMLGNIALIPVMVHMRNYLLEVTNGDFALTCYADDIQISVNENVVPLKEVEQTLHNYLALEGLELNRNKTRVKYEKYGARRILGVNVTNDGILPTRKTNRKVRAVRHQVNKGEPKGSVLGGLTTWQQCNLPKDVLFLL